MKHASCTARLVLVTLCLFASGRATADGYAVTDLGSLGGNYTFATGINDLGQVVGSSEISNMGSSPTHAFLWLPAPAYGLPAGMNDVGTLGGRDSFATGINPSGLVIGASYTARGDQHAFLWKQGLMQDLGTLGGSSSTATGINSCGQVVGNSYVPGGNYYNRHAFLWTPGGTDGVPSNPQMKDLGTLGRPYSEATSINNLGQVVGSVGATNGFDAFLWLPTPAYGLPAQMNDLGALPSDFPYSSAWGINDLGQVVGDSATTSRSHGFVWDSMSGIQDLGTLGGDSFSRAYGISNYGQMVGVSITLGEVNSAVLWDSISGIQDLNSLIPPESGWLLQEARAINAAGQIVGFGYNGLGTAFLLTPE